MIFSLSLSFFLSCLLGRQLDVDLEYIHSYIKWLLNLWKRDCRPVATLPIATLVDDNSYASSSIPQQRLVTVDIQDLVQHLAAAERKKVRTSKRKRRSNNTTARVDSDESSSDDSEE